jgi:hypothetical protein
MCGRLPLAPAAAPIVNHTEAAITAALAAIVTVRDGQDTQETA